MSVHHAPAVIAAPLATQRAERTPSLFGCPVFPPGDMYNSNVSNTPPDRYSSERIASLVAGGATKGLYAADDEYINVATGATPVLSLKTANGVHHSIPWSRQFRIESAGDHHVIVLQKDTCTLYEAYAASYVNGRFNAYSQREWNLRRAYPRTGPARILSGMASGLPLGAGAFRYEDFARGRIDHALNWAPPQQAIQPFVFVSPASDTGDSMPYAGPSGFAHLMPYGARIRLKGAFVLHCTCPQAQMVVAALKTYGAFLADTGSAGVGWTAIYTTAKPDGTTWTDNGDLSNLKGVTLKNFDVLPFGRIYDIRR